MKSTTASRAPTSAIATDVEPFRPERGWLLRASGTFPDTHIHFPTGTPRGNDRGVPVCFCFSPQLCSLSAPFARSTGVFSIHAVQSINLRTRRTYVPPFRDNQSWMKSLGGPCVRSENPDPGNGHSLPGEHNTACRHSHAFLASCSDTRDERLTTEAREPEKGKYSVGLYSSEKRQTLSVKPFGADSEESYGRRSGHE